MCSRAEVLRGGEGVDRLASGPGTGDALHGDEGDDKVFLAGEATMAYGGAGHDGITAMATATNVLIDGGDDADTLVGSDSADRILGGGGMDILGGEGGADELRGGAGDDTLGGGTGPDQLFGESENDVCRGGPGEDYCHGGTPGPEENTFDDPDICEDDVETMASCSDSAPPEIFLATVAGEGTYAPDGIDRVSDIGWSMSFDLVMVDQLGEDVYYEVESGSGSYEIDGHNFDCTISGADSFTLEDWMGDLRLSLDADTYDFGIGNGEATQDTTWDCPEGSWTLVPPAVTEP